MKKIFDKYKWSGTIEFTIIEPEATPYYSDKKTITIRHKANKKQLRNYEKGVKLSMKYVNKMKKLGFKTLDTEKESE